MRNEFGKTERTVATLLAGASLVMIGLALTKPHVAKSNPYFTPLPEPVVQPPRIFVPPVQPQQTFRPPIVVPTDVTGPNLPEGFNDPTGSAALAGIKEIKGFPAPENLSGPVDFILVKSGQNTDFKKDNPYTVSLDEGSLLVGVKKPSNIGMVQTPVGRVALYANADALVSVKNGVMRVMNLDGLGNNIRVSLPNGKVYSLSPGYELVVSKTALTRDALKPNDGLARRQMKVIEDGTMAIGQFSVESFLQSSTIVAEMRQSESGAKERRVLADVSRMAAVLNHVHGGHGYNQ